MFLFIVLLVFLVDQLTKYLAKSFLSLHQSRPIFSSYLKLTLVHNRGAAFGLFAERSFFLTLLSLLTITVVIILRYRWRLEKKSLQFPLALILGGALGNLCDRLKPGGYVIDFIDIGFKNYRWPAFNLADSVICVGAAFLCWQMIQRRDH